MHEQNGKLQGSYLQFSYLYSIIRGQSGAEWGEMWNFGAKLLKTDVKTVIEVHSIRLQAIGLP